MARSFISNLANEYIARTDNSRAVERDQSEASTRVCSADDPCASSEDNAPDTRRVSHGAPEVHAALDVSATNAVQHEVARADIARSRPNTPRSRTSSTRLCSALGSSQDSYLAPVIKLRMARDEQSHADARARSANSRSASFEPDALGLKAGTEGAPDVRTAIDVDVGATDAIHPTSGVVHAVSIASTGAVGETSNGRGAAGAQNASRYKGAKANPFDVACPPLPFPHPLSPFVSLPPWRTLPALLKPEPDNLCVRLPPIDVPHAFADCPPLDDRSHASSPFSFPAVPCPNSLDLDGAFSPHKRQNTLHTDRDALARRHDSRPPASDADAGCAYQDAPQDSACEDKASESRMTCKHCADGCTCPEPRCP
jgi:hypothetical protein